MPTGTEPTIFSASATDIDELIYSGAYVWLVQEIIEQGMDLGYHPLDMPPPTPASAT